MGITLSGKPDSRITVKSLDMSYGGFFRLRCMAAKQLNDEFYHLYRSMMNNRSEDDWKAVNFFIFVLRFFSQM